jgi:hypothetical protein
MVLVIDRHKIAESTAARDSFEDLGRRVAELEVEGLDQRAALKRAAREMGLSRSEAYRRLTAFRSRSKE